MDLEYASTITIPQAITYPLIAQQSDDSLPYVFNYPALLTHPIVLTYLNQEPNLRRGDIVRFEGFDDLADYNAYGWSGTNLLSLDEDHEDKYPGPPFSIEEEPFHFTYWRDQLMTVKVEVPLSVRQAITEDFGLSANSVGDFTTGGSAGSSSIANFISFEFRDELWALLVPPGLNSEQIVELLTDNSLSRTVVPTSSNYLISNVFHINPLNNDLVLQHFINPTYQAESYGIWLDLLEEDLDEMGVVPDNVLAVNYP